MPDTERHAMRPSTATTDRVAWGDQPRSGVLERGREPRPRPRPRHRRDHHPVARTRHPTGRGLQEHRCRAHVQAPPAPWFLAHVIARAAPPAPRAPRRHPRLRPHPRDELLPAPPVGLQVHRLDHRVLDPEQPPPYPRCAHAVPVLIVPDCGRPETLARARRAPLLIMHRHPQERQ